MQLPGPPAARATRKQRLGGARSAEDPTPRERREGWERAGVPSDRPRQPVGLQGKDRGPELGGNDRGLVLLAPEKRRPAEADLESPRAQPCTAPGTWGWSLAGSL